MQPLYYEDYTSEWEMVTEGRTVTEYDILQFVTLAGLNEALFLDMEYLKNESQFERRLAPGALCFSYAEGLVISSGCLANTGLAYLGGEMTIKRPLYVKDTIRVRVTLQDKRETRKTDRGIVTTCNQVINQDGELVMEYTPARMIRRRG